MKFFGNSKNAKHSNGKRSETNKKKPEKRKKLNIWLRVLIILLAIIAVLAIAVAVYWKTQVKPPDVVDNKNQGGINRPNDSDEAPDVIKDKDERTGEKYTFLIMGMDDGNGNTDTMMVATFDTSDYSLNVVSIPRDTMVNVSWYTKKVNTLYANTGIEGTKEHLANVFGYEVDFYAIVDIEAFVKLIDEIGGVYYDVPVNMNYIDEAQDLYINISKGPQWLDGEDALKVMRFRKGYADADIGRIDTQQDFLMTVANQLLENSGDISLTTLADVFVNYVDTDLTSGNVIWFAKELLKMDSENINFMTVPGKYDDYINKTSYVSIYVDEWIEMINEYLNPFDEDITIENLDILTRDSSGKLYATTGVRQGNSSWGRGSGSGSNFGGNSGNSGGSSGNSEPTTPPDDDPGSGGEGTGTEADPPVTDPGTTGEGPTTDPITDPSEGSGTGTEQPDDGGETTAPPMDVGTGDTGNGGEDAVQEPVPEDNAAA